MMANHVSGVHSLLSRRIVVERPPMRINDELLKSVAYLAECIPSGDGGTTYDLIGTGFFVSIPSTVLPLKSHLMFVTAKHLLLGMEQRELVIVVNNKTEDKTVIVGPVPYGEWTFHPTDEAADVAGLSLGLPDICDINTIEVSRVLTPESIQKQNIGIGDELYIIGLFTNAPGHSKIMPLVRHGNIAMLPRGPIQVSSGFADVYLAEMRSIGGLSGSPAFARKTYVMQVETVGGSRQPLHALGNEVFLLGLVQSHWDIEEKDINKPSFIQNRQRGVNLGIGVIVPGYKIREVIDHPKLKAIRDNSDGEMRRAITPEPD